MSGGTPLLQTAVNNGFGTLNTTSPCGEHLRNFNALPLLDWALAFKPQYLAFFLADPVYAFSIHQAAFIGLFLADYHRFLRTWGWPRPRAPEPA